MVDDHNNRRHSPISFETNWATKTWEHRVFAFVLAITEVNVMLAGQYFDNDSTDSQVEFRKKLANALIYNKYMHQEEFQINRRSKRKSVNLDHMHMTLPNFKKFVGNVMTAVSMKYGQYKCSSCPKKVRTYCICCPGKMLCVECYASHVREVNFMVGSPRLNLGDRF
jgi:hypothetical protein